MIRDGRQAFGGGAGQGLVELALTLPVVLLLLIGLVDFARGLQNYQALTNAVREAAREASVHGSGSAAPWGPAANDAAVVVAVRGRAVGLVTDAVSVTSVWPTGNNARGSEIVIGATYTFRPVALNVVGDLAVPLSASTRTRIQY